MDHSWRPPPILQGNNICPTCSNIHFPFCPPHPHPNSDPNYRPINMNRPVFNNPGYPYYDPMYCNQNPNFGNVNRSPYSMQNHGYDYSNVNDRSSKRLRVDGDANYSALNFPVEDKERNYKLDYEHDVPNLGYNGDNMRGYALQNSVFGRNFDGWNPGIPSEFGIRPPSNAEMSSNPAGVGYGVPYQNDHPVAHPIHQGGIGHDNDRQSHGYNHHRNYGVSHGSSESFYGRSMESMHYYSAPMHYDQRSNTPTYNHYSSSHPPLPSATQQPGQLRYDYGSPRPLSDVRQPIETGPPPIEGYQVPGGNHIVAARPPFGHPRMENQGAYGNPISENMGRLHASQGFDVQPPLPASPPPPLPLEPPPLHWQADHKLITSPHTVSSSLFPVPVGSSAPVHSSHAPIPESHAQATSHLLNSPHGHMSHGVFQGDPRNSLTSFGQYLGDSQRFPPKNNFPDKPKTIDAANLFKTPHRSSRPDHFVIILRGLPGSGKSYLAKMLRDLEVEHGGNAPRIHSMDDYFMTEVEKVEEESSKSSARFKKPTMKKVLEYCYEPEMEEAYRSSMLKSFKKTLEDGTFTFVIVDDRNLRVADFAQFWATAKRSGYEVYVLEAPYKDPAGCTARNVHGFTQVDVEKMAAQWEEAPSMYLQVDVKSLFHGDDLKESNIEEVDMDTEDGDVEGDLFKLNDRGVEIATSSAGDQRSYVLQKDGENWDAEVGHAAEEVKDIGSSKWSSILDDDDDERTEVLKDKSRKANVPSGLFRRTYGREGKSVHWGDQGSYTGFSIGAVKKANLASLVIGPGAGYNLKANPLPKEDAASSKSGEAKKNSVFQERLRAEKESFRAVFDRRRHRISGVDAED